MRSVGDPTHVFDPARGGKRQGVIRKLLPRTRTAFESRTQVWREVGLGSEIDPAAARRSKGEALLLLALIGGVLFCFTERKTLFPATASR